MILIKYLTSGSKPGKEVKRCRECLSAEKDYISITQNVGARMDFPDYIKK